jgi:hypothetical protein
LKKKKERNIEQLQHGGCMAQSKKPRRPRREPPLKVKVVYAPPPPGSEDGWLRALKILMEATEKEKDNHEQREP